MTACVALYVSGHGYGHAVRSAEVASELLACSARVLVRTDAPQWLFPASAAYVGGAPIDIGVAQHDGLELDVDETRARWTGFMATFSERAAAEASLLRDHGVDFVLGDIPPLAFAAAARAGLPSAAVGNFTWDWIYGAWPGFDSVISCIRKACSQADVLFRLPLHSRDDDAFSAFRAVEDVPLIARRARRSRSAVRTDLGLDESSCAILLSFGAFTADGLSIDALRALSECCFVITPPLAVRVQDPPSNVLLLPQQPADYPSLLAACDAVITKPGYGIVADCIANHTAVLYTSRGPFREYDVLVEALHAYGRAHYIPREDLLTGNLAPHLATLLAQPNTWTDLPLNGAEAIAARVLQRVSNPPRA